MLSFLLYQLVNLDCPHPRLSKLLVQVNRLLVLLLIAVLVRVPSNRKLLGGLEKLSVKLIVLDQCVEQLELNVDVP